MQSRAAASANLRSILSRNKTAARASDTRFCARSDVAVNSRDAFAL